MSFANNDRDPAVQDLLRKAQHEGIVLVAAAGNKGRKPPPVFPAAYSGVIAVTAVDYADRRWEDANRGPYMTVAAPGSNSGAGRAWRLRLPVGHVLCYGVCQRHRRAAPGARPDHGSCDHYQTDRGRSSRPWAGRPRRRFGAGRVNALTSLKLIRKVAAR